jgi:uncharacterized protein
MATRSNAADGARQQLDNPTARRLFMDRHALIEPPTGGSTGQDLLDLITRLGFVQLDSINTVARAHDLILFSRRPRYRTQHLKQLYERDRDLFEHWTHDAAVIPMEFYPQWHLRFQRDAEKLRHRYREWRRSGFEKQFEKVLAHIREQGPVSSSDVGKDEAKGSGGWWDWHPSKTALEYLWRSGALAVVGRDGFKKRYDLTERVIELSLCPGQTPCDANAILDWHCKSALDRLGFATSGEIAAFWDTVTPSEARAWCAAKVKSGDLEQIDVAGSDGKFRTVLACPGVVEAAARIEPAPNRIRVLSPFDPALRDRNRAERLFGFHYRIEVFVPEAKRKYGYYVFPLLEGERLIGRINMKAHRNEDVMRVTALWPERGTKWSGAKQKRLEAELQRITRLAGVASFEFADGWLKHPV